MKIFLDGKKIGLKELQQDLSLMAQERILSQFLRDDYLAWFFHYHPIEVRRLERILSQARAQYLTLSDDEQDFVDVLTDFYEDFKSFNWGLYHHLLRIEDTPNQLGYEADTALRWGRKLRDLTGSVEPLEVLLQVAEIKYTQGPYRIRRPATFGEGEVKGQ